MLAQRDALLGSEPVPGYVESPCSCSARSASVQVNGGPKFGSGRGGLDARMWVHSAAKAPLFVATLASKLRRRYAAAGRGCWAISCLNTASRSARRYGFLRIGRSSRSARSP